MGKEAAITIDVLMREDLDQVMTIENASFSMPWSKNLFLSEFRNPAVSLKLAALGDTAPRSVAGYIICWVFVDELHILNLTTRPDLRRRGIARRLVLETFERAYTRGARKAFLEVRASNRAAQRLYESMGFVRMDVRRDYYDLPVEDAIVMMLPHERFLSLIGLEKP